MKMLKYKNICIITGSRSEYYLLKKIIIKLKKEKYIKTSLVVTGSHLSKKFGLTYSDIKKDLIKIDKKINIKIEGDQSLNIAKSTAVGIQKFSEYFNRKKFDLIIILGDRYEIFSSAVAAYINKIPMAHIHGGESTEGSLDEGIRHSITKMSHIHFVATKKYLSRVIQLGENPKLVFNVGGLGVDSIKNTKLILKHTLEKKLNIKFLKKNCLITFHPETLEKTKNNKSITNIIYSIKKFKDMSFFFTMPSADQGSFSIINEIKKFVKNNKNAYFFNSLGHEKYFSLCNHVDFMIGNSSSGILEMPSFKKATINIGNRQKGRIKASSIINISSDKNEILHAIKKVYSRKFQIKVKSTSNPYGKGGASEKIVQIIKKINLKNIIYKKFFDIR